MALGAPQRRMKAGEESGFVFNNIDGFFRRRSPRRAASRKNSETLCVGILCASWQPKARLNRGQSCGRRLLVPFSGCSESFRILSVLTSLLRAIQLR
jgi:hypothetical protein